MRRLFSNPYLVGIAIGLLGAIGLIVCVIWFPGILEERNKWWRDFAFFTAFLFFVLISRNWQSHARLKLWILLVLLLVCHSAILLFINHIYQLAPIQYVFLTFFEAVAADVLLQSSMARGA